MGLRKCHGCHWFLRAPIITCTEQLPALASRTDRTHTPLERMYPPAWLLVTIAFIFTIIARICVIIILPKDGVPRRRNHRETCHLAVFLGSGKSSTQSPAATLGLYRNYLGGHSSEALTLVSTLDFARYTPRTYLVSEGDSLSATKAIALERLKAASGSSLVSAASSRSCLTLTDRVSGI